MKYNTQQIINLLIAIFLLPSLALADNGALTDTRAIDSYTGEKHLKAFLATDVLANIGKVENDLGDEEDEQEFHYNGDKCIECHYFTDQELKGQLKRARKRHMQVRTEKKVCSECHDKDEVVGICCHAAYPK